MRIDAVAYRATNACVSHPRPFVLSPSKGLSVSKADRASPPLKPSRPN
jgi:hypothetical protein